MEDLYFLCPTCGSELEIGIATELNTLLRIRDRRVRALCPRCGRTHEWQIRDAGLKAAA